ncbi:hypothetical protein J6590_102249, partial [Homalodisca vitripennis]
CSVSVSAWTLVVISLERYYDIDMLQLAACPCRPGRWCLQRVRVGLDAGGDICREILRHWTLVVISLERYYDIDMLQLAACPCRLACSVSVSAWTLVVISVERYYAICHPLRSRRWQTLSHAYRMIIAIWMSSLFTMAPIAYLSQLIPTNQGHRKCREIWPSRSLERMYNILLDALLLVLPLVGLTATYSLITHTLWKGMQLQNGGQGK